MHSHHAAFFAFREVTKSLVDLSEAQQVLILKFELLHALERIGELVNLLLVWAPSQATRQQILVENPRRLFGFD